MSLQKLHTELDTRILRFDGVSIVNPEFICEFLLKGIAPSELRTSVCDEEIELFNKFSPTNPIKLAVNESIKFDLTWQLPKQYQDLNVQEYLFERFSQRSTKFGYSDAQFNEAAERVLYEYSAFKRNGLLDLLRCLIYVLDEFKKHDIIYGVGRGSSCASFILYLMGVHMVDPIKYKISVHEFFREEAGGEL
jgi:DNA polymerase III alpha subunit